MKKTFLLLIVVVWNYLSLPAQVNWKDTGLSFSEIEWNNYSTTYLGEGSDSTPLLVTAIPYNGIYSIGDGIKDHSPMDMSFTGSAFRFRSNLSADQMLYTYDSSAVYFLAPGIFRSNADRFEYRILQNDSDSTQPWSNITEFTGGSFRLNQFRCCFAFLGGHTAFWGKYIIVELRRKDQQEPFTRTIVYWQEIKPVLMTVLTSHELNERLMRLKAPFDLYSSLKGLPRHLVLPPEEKELTVFVNATIYKKEALEYQLKRNGRILTAWKPNDVDNNFIWLHNLGAGEYTLEMRYRKQRHNVTTYSFKIRAAWYETVFFKIVIAGLLLTFIGFMVLLFKYRRQRQKTTAEIAKQEKLELGLKSVHAQLNPHFIFNALSSIQSLINKNDIQNANRYLSLFGSLVRSSLTNSEKQFIPLKREIEILDTYLTLEKLRFNFSYTIHVEEGLPVAETEIPSFLLQPLAENAVKHGVASLQGQGTIQVTFTKQGNDLYARISDNGNGFIPDQATAGYGLKLTRNRIQLVNELSADRSIQMNISSPPGKGATIELLFKNWLA